MGTFIKAQKFQRKAHIALVGKSGTGKTLGGLYMLKGMGCKKIAVIDTENFSSSLYAGEVPFDVISLEAPYTVDRHIALIEAAEKEGYDGLLIDSLSHAWEGEGGLLEYNETMAQKYFKGNTWSAWSKTTPEYKRLINKIIQSSMHIIATFRTKTEWIRDETEKGSSFRKVGTSVTQRGGIEYEFDLVLQIEADHSCFADKTRYLELGWDEKKISKITPDLGAQLIKYLEKDMVGGAPKPEPEPLAAAEDRKSLVALTEQLGWAQEDATKWIEEKTGKKATSQLTKKEIESLITECKVQLAQSLSGGQDQ